MTEVVTQATDLNSAVRGHAFPALESGNTSFPNGRYVVRFEPGKDGSSFTVCSIASRVRRSSRA